jgi:hypothetical protein
MREYFAQQVRLQARDQPRPPDHLFVVDSEHVRGAIGIELIPFQLIRTRELGTTTLPNICVVWLLVIVSLYPLYRWFAALKQRRREWWLSYL